MNRTLVSVLTAVSVAVGSLAAADDLPTSWHKWLLIAMSVLTAVNSVYGKPLKQPAEVTKEEPKP